MEIPAVEFDDHLLVREQGVHLPTSNLRGHHRLWEPEVPAEGWEVVFPTGTGRPAFRFYELGEPAGAGMARKPLDHVGQVMPAHQLSPESLVDGARNRFLAEQRRAVEQRPRWAGDADAVLAAEVAAKEASGAVKGDAGAGMHACGDHRHGPGPRRQVPQRECGAVAEAASGPHAITAAEARSSAVLGGRPTA